MGAQVESLTRSPEVGIFRQILIWPLLLKFRRGSFSGEEVLKECARKLKESWEKVDIAAERRAKRIPYEEIVYFHPFVRDFLYGDAKEKPPSMHLFRRKKVEAVSFVLRGDDSNPRTYNSRVNRVELYVFDTAIALFVIELEHPVVHQEEDETQSKLGLGEVETILDEFRRAYPPYWNAHEDRSRTPGRTPLEVTWILKDKIEPKVHKPIEQELREDVSIGAEPPMAGHWLTLLNPLVPYQGGSPKDQHENSLPVQQIQDERIPSMCYLAFDNPRNLSKGDMVRIALLDARGPSETLPYSRTFLENFDKEYCYDAFWGPKTAETPCSDREISEGDDLWWTTRYMCSGYGFTVLGHDDRGADYPFFTDQMSGILFHFSHHYFKIGLIAHFHRASLLMFSDRLSEAVKVLESKASGSVRYDQLRDEVRIIREEFLRFRSRYWFDELSNQLQPRLLFDLWSGHLQTRKLFTQVLDEVSTINAVLDANQQEEQTAATVRLTVVGTIGVAITLGLTALQLVSSESRALWAYPVAFIICALFLTWLISASVPIGKVFESWAIKGAPVWRCLAPDSDGCPPDPRDFDPKEPKS